MVDAGELVLEGSSPTSDGSRLGRLRQQEEVAPVVGRVVRCAHDEVAVARLGGAALEHEQHQVGPESKGRRHGRSSFAGGRACGRQPGDPGST
jgi:hypothetical protein